jgi:hypothetical protein
MSSKTVLNGFEITIARRANIGEAEKRYEAAGHP